MIFIGDITPKIKVFLFLSIISLLINLSIVGVASLSQETQFTSINTENPDLSTKNQSVGTIGNVAVATGTSFIPFVSLINIATLNLTEIPLILIFYTLFTVILESIKLFILSTIILNILPFWNI